jgi:hypothetical protein
LGHSSCWTHAAFSAAIELQVDGENVYRPLSVDVDSLRHVLGLTTQNIAAPYHPTPTIVEAARSLYAQYSIEAIACFDAGAKNLRLISLQGDRRLVRDR